MIHAFVYPTKLTKQREGGYTVTFPDVPEAITQGETETDALCEAVDCLEEAIANRMAMKLSIPVPSLIKGRQKPIGLSTTLAAKAALYVAMQEQHLTKISLARKLNCDEKEVRRLLDPHYHSKLPGIERALNLLGYRLAVQLY